MGILKLYPFLKDEGCGAAFRTVPLLTFANHRIPIDASGWSFTYFAPQWKEVVMKSINPIDEDPDMAIAWKATKEKFLGFILDYLKCGITPVFIFDGEEIPDKVETKKKRAEKNKKTKDEANALREELRGVPSLLRQPQAVQKYKEKLCWSLPLRNNNIEELKSMCDGIGIPWLVAPNEGEAYASHLAMEGLGIAIWSNDSDPHAIGCPITIQGFEAGSRGQNVEVVLVPPILRGLNMSQDIFRDLCIMGGCDFNTNITRVAIATALKKLRQYGSVEDYLRYNPQVDGSVLNLDNCRKYLGYKPTGISHEDTRLNVNPVKLLQNGFDMLKSLGFEGHYSSLSMYISNMQHPQKADHSSMALLKETPVNGQQVSANYSYLSISDPTTGTVSVLTISDTTAVVAAPNVQIASPLVILP